MKEVFTGFFTAIFALCIVTFITALAVVRYAASFAVPTAVVIFVLRYFGIV